MAGKTKTYLRADIESYILEWEKSGKSKKQFCRENNITESLFYYWYKRYKLNRTSINDEFIPIIIKPKATHPENRIDIHYPNGVKLTLSGKNDTTFLRALIGIR